MRCVINIGVRQGTEKVVRNKYNIIKACGCTNIFCLILVILVKYRNQNRCVRVLVTPN